MTKDDREQACECGHDLKEHDKGRECLADTNPNGKRTVFCKCKGFKEKLK